VAKKVLLIVFGTVLTLLGIALTVGGVVLLALTGGDGYFGSGTETVRTPTRALVSEPAVLETGRDGFDATVRIRVAAASGDAVFIGVGPTTEVDRYLAGSSYDEVRDVEFSPFRYSTVRRDGEDEPAPPADQPLWTARATGTGEQTIEIRLDQGDYRLVVMNADASSGVDVRASFGIRLPFLRRLGLGLTIGGVLAVLGGILLLVWGLRTKVPPRQPPAWVPYGPGYAPYGPGPAPAGYGPPPPAYPYPPGPPPPGWPPPAAAEPERAEPPPDGPER
jgi:hypothetical protein